MSAICSPSWYVDALRALYWDGQLYGAAEGIYRQLDARGVESLSERQLALVERLVDGFCARSICPRHGAAIDIDEVDSFLRSGLCSSCEYRSQKDD